MIKSFEHLTPELVISSVESELAIPLAGFASPFPSYINRVYELSGTDNTRYVAKFYRPGRWERDAILDEHSFVRECAVDEIPVVAPLTLANGTTLGETEGIIFAVYPKRSGRGFEMKEEGDWQRLGRVLARMHNAGARAPAMSRITMHPEESALNDIEEIVTGGFLPLSCQRTFKDTCFRILDETAELFDGIEFIRIHGDCHRANVLERPDEGLMIIDFDDMANGPAVQDFWLLLPGHPPDCMMETELILDGYRQFRDFDDSTLNLIEPLRAMRIIYFLAWCARQSNDINFKHNFPDWGGENFWRKENADLERQLQIIKNSLENPLY
ncbi:MAG: hypothetical protein A2020_14895 [Lentisphaerae bacterium GWF2_45_14]|nr:MAG: hypothetical protein A2020_14895 [Lentisphaerae bacterium GWF2_45_14]